MNKINFGNVIDSLTSAVSVPGFYQIVWTLIFILGGFLLNRLVVRTINKRMDDTNRRHVFRKIANYLTTALIILCLLFIWVKNLTFLTALTGFLAAGLAIALRDIILSFFGWLKIISTRPFSVGDRIQVEGLEGDIIDVSPLHTVILEVGNWVEASQSTGRIVFIPNNIIFLQSVFNSTQGFPYLWDEFSIVVTFESDYQTAKELLRDQVDDVVGINYRRVRREIQRMKDRYAIQYENLNSRVYTSIQDHGVKLTIRYLTKVRGRREVKSRLSQKIMSLLEEHSDVELAYPTYRVFRRDVEQTGDQDELNTEVQPEEES